MKQLNYYLLFVLAFFSVISCDNDDDTPGIISVPVRDRAEQYLVDLDSIEEYLSTHFYNYEEFQANPNTTDFNIVFDTIAGVNSDKTPLIDQVEELMIMDQDYDVEYKIYYLSVRGGEGDTPTYADSTFVEYKGMQLDGTVFDSSVNPVWLDLARTVEGYREISTLFSGASGDLIDNGDGTISFQNFGIGAMFIPSGLGYYALPPSNIPVYSPLIFTINMYDVNKYTDHDDDGVPSYLEDIDLNRDVNNDNTDGDLSADYSDNDDDGDGTLTIDEVEFNTYVYNPTMGDQPPTLASNEYIRNEVEDEQSGEITLSTVVLIDTDGDSTPDYLDTDNS